MVGGVLVENRTFSSVLLLKIAKKKPHQKGGGSSCFQVSSSFSCLPFSALVFFFPSAF